MPDPDDVADAIARNTRALRAERQWTLDQLAAAVRAAAEA